MRIISKNLVFILLLLSGTFNLFAQAPDTLWTRTYGGIANEAGNSVQQTTDGGYIITGYTNSFGAGSKDVYLIKTDSIGDTLWIRTFGGFDSDEGMAVKQTPDNGFAVAGYSFSAEPYSSQCYLIKTNYQGDSLWAKYYGGAFIYDRTWSMELTNDSGYILAGVTETDIPHLKNVDIYKIDSLGNVIWITTLGGMFYWSEAYSVQQTLDNGYIMVGYRDSIDEYNNNCDVYLVKTDSLGDSLWAKTYGGQDSDRGYSVEQTNDGGYVIAGYTKSFGSGNADIYIIRTDSIGDTLWTRTFGGDSNEIAYSVQQTQDKGYIIAGYTESFGAGKSDFWLIRTDSLGDTIWTRTFGGSEQDEAYCIQQTSNGGYIVSGFTKSFSVGGSDVYLIKIESDAGIEENSFSDNFFVCQSNPNPFINKTTIKYEIPRSCNVNISIYNALGARIKVLLNERQNAGTHAITWNGRDASGNKVSSGFYFLRLEADGNRETRKLLLLR